MDPTGCPPLYATDNGLYFGSKGKGCTIYMVTYWALYTIVLIGAIFLIMITNAIHIYRYRYHVPSKGKKPRVFSLSLFLQNLSLSGGIIFFLLVGLNIVSNRDFSSPLVFVIMFAPVYFVLELAVIKMVQASAKMIPKAMRKRKGVEKVVSFKADPILATLLTLLTSCIISVLLIWSILGIFQAPQNNDLYIQCSMALCALFWFLSILISLRQNERLIKFMLEASKTHHLEAGTQPTMNDDPGNSIQIAVKRLRLRSFTWLISFSIIMIVQILIASGIFFHFYSVYILFIITEVSIAAGAYVSIPSAWRKDAKGSSSKTPPEQDLAGGGGKVTKPKSVRRLFTFVNKKKTSGIDQTDGGFEGDRKIHNPKAVAVSTVIFSEEKIFSTVPGTNYGDHTIYAFDENVHSLSPDTGDHHAPVIHEE